MRVSQIKTEYNLFKLKKKRKKVHQVRCWWVDQKVCDLTTNRIYYSTHWIERLLRSP